SRRQLHRDICDRDSHLHGDWQVCMKGESRVERRETRVERMSVCLQRNRRLFLKLSSLVSGLWTVRLLSLVSGLWTVTPNVAAQSDAVPAARSAARAWFQDAKLGMFVHWGAYSQL